MSRRDGKLMGILASDTILTVDGVEVEMCEDTLILYDYDDACFIEPYLRKEVHLSAKEVYDAATRKHRLTLRDSLYNWRVNALNWLVVKLKETTRAV